MSLKAKIEAVIYASDEPVTLSQLVGLLGEEAQAELDRAAETQRTLSLYETEAEAGVGADSTLGQELDPGDAGEAVAPADETEVAAEPVDSTDAEAAAAAAKAEKARVAKLRGYFRVTLDGLIAEYTSGDRGLEIREVAGGFRFATKPEYHDAVRGFVKSLKPPLKLSLQALETLAVVAYKQPVTSPEISEIRGVDSSGVLGSLIARKLITTAGRKQVIGRPILYKTTREFLLKFGLKDVAELPSIEEFEKMAGQMAEQEEMTMGEPHDSHEPDAYAPHDESESAAADNVSDETGDKASVDGRVSSLPPNYANDSDDPSAEEGEIQSGEDS